MKDQTEEHAERHAQKKQSDHTAYMAISLLLVASLAVLAFNQVAMANLGVAMTAKMTDVATATASGSSVSSAVSGPNVIPTGVPAVYGSELGIRYDDVSATDQARADATIRKLAMFDVSIELSGETLQRYISTVSRMSCEYCCGADSIIFSDGQPACGCAHSYAMRGLAKYLLTKHPAEFTDDQILEELGKWKTLFFPGQITAKAAILQQQGVELNYINLASNKYRGIETQASGSGSGMVGGC